MMGVMNLTKRVSLHRSVVPQSSANYSANEVADIMAKLSYADDVGE
jgi:hypothetical protein